VVDEEHCALRGEERAGSISLSRQEAQTIESYLRRGLSENWMNFAECRSSQSFVNN